jgi:cell division septum initiation protein DivIVA
VGKIGLVELLDRLEGTIEEGKRMPLTNKVLVDAYDVLEILDQVRISLPDEVKKAEELLKERDKIISEATREGQSLRESAGEYLKSMVSKEEVVKAAEIESKRIVDEAKLEAEDIRKGASQYAADVLSKLEENLDRALEVVRRGVEELEKSSA